MPISFKSFFAVNMVQLTTQQRVFVVERYIRSNSYIVVRREFREQFPDREPPAKRTIQQNVAKYRNFGTSLNMNKGNYGLPRTSRTPENIQRVRNHLENNPVGVSARRNGLAISATTFNRITCEELHCYPYQIVVRHQLK